MLRALKDNCTPASHMIVIVVICLIYVQTMIARSFLYLFYIGALGTRSDPSPADLNDKSYVLSHIQIYRWLFVANTYLSIALGALVIDSLVIYPWNVVLLITTGTFLQIMLKHLAFRIRLDPPFDDIAEYMGFLILRQNRFRPIRVFLENL